MNPTFLKILRLVESGAVRISDHADKKIVEDELSVRQLVQSAKNGIVIEDYPTFPKGPCVLVLQPDGEGRPIHVIWGIPKGFEGPVVLVTAYRPDSELWEHGFMRRKR